jgi:hypothetical protein
LIRRNNVEGEKEENRSNSMTHYKALHNLYSSANTDHINENEMRSASSKHGDTRECTQNVSENLNG